MSETPYRGAHRRDLDDMTEIDRLEAEKRGAPDPAAAQQEEGPAPENEPPKPPQPPQNAEEASYAKRYGDLRRHAQQTEARLKGEIEAIKKQLEQASKRTLQLPSSEEEVASWAREYPDVARIVESIAAKKADERASEVEKRVQAAEARERDAAKRAAMAELLRLHPDFNELRNEPSFHEWAGQQPRWVQASLYEDLDPRAAARAIDLYKLDTAPKRGRPKKEPEQAAEVPSGARRSAPDPAEGRGKTWRESEIAKLTPQQYEAAEDEIYQARREGRMVYDLQSAAA